MRCAFCTLVRRPQFLGLLWAASALSACAMAASSDEPEVDYVLVEPTLESIQPDEIVLGESIKVFGENFIPPEHGSLGLLLEGEYLDSDGRSHSFRGEVALTVQNDKVAELRFEELFFHPNGDRIGTWSGTAMLVNRTEDDEMWSQAQEEILRVGPSIRIARLGSADATGCSPVTSGTNGGQNLALAFQVLGAGRASEQRPWRARVSFQSPDVEVRYFAPQTISTWPIDATNQLVAEGAQGFNRLELAVDSGDTVSIDPLVTGRTVEINPPVTIGEAVLDEVVLGMLRAGEVEFGGVNSSFFVIEVDTGSEVLHRQVDFDIRSEFEIGIWGGSERLVERYQPEATSGCTPGQRIGRDLRYSEREVERRSRKIEVKWESEIEQKLGFTEGIKVAWFAAESQQLFSWSSKFGINVEEAVSSATQSSQALSIFVLPGHYGMSYRQLERLERTVELVYHNACGNSGPVGDAVLTNWNFGFDVAQDLGCPPATTLPPAQAFPGPE